jgi:hypothetical protein
MNYPIGLLIVKLWESKGGPRERLSLAEVMTLNILRFYLRVQSKRMNIPAYFITNMFCMSQVVNTLRNRSCHSFPSIPRVTGIIPREGGAIRSALDTLK